MKIFTGLSAFAILALLAAQAFTAPSDEALQTAGSERVDHGELTGMLSSFEGRAYYGGFMIASGDTVSGPLLVMAGTLDIQDGGVLDGDAWVVNGRLIMTGASVISGGVSLVNSGEFLSYEASLEGDIRRFDCECKLDGKRFEEEGEIIFKESIDPRVVRTKWAVKPVSGGRVDYSIAAIGLKRENKLHREPYVKGHVLLIPAIFKKTTGYIGFDAECDIPLRGEKLGLVLHGFARTFSSDDWMISMRENSFITLMTGDDFLDYWERQGGEIGLVYRPVESLSLDTRLSLQRDRSLDAHRISSILYPVRKFRANPPVDEGTRMALTGRLRIDTRGEEAWRDDAWLVDLWVEKGIADGPGEFSYTAFDLDLRRYDYLPWRMRFDTRAKVFSSFTRLPGQVSRTLNGYAGVRGASDMPFGPMRGDRMALFSAEFRRSLPDMPVFEWIFTRWDLMVFTDIGIVAQADDPESPFGFFELPWDDWKKTAGIGVSGESFLPYLGLYVARDLDPDDGGTRLILRIERSF